MLENAKRDLLIECFPLYRDSDLIFHGTDDETDVIGFYNRGKINPKEPDLRVYRLDDAGVREDKEFLSLWVKESRTGRKYLIGNCDGVCYVGLIHFNRFSETDPYLTIYQVLKFNK